MALRIRRRGSGRSLVATRANEANAAAFSISPSASKLIAFAVAGGLAGLAGVFLGANAPAGFASTDPTFSSVNSIQVVSIAVIGGVTSVPGAIIGTLWVVGLPAFFPGSDRRLLTSGIGLLLVLLYFPGGLNQVFVEIRTAAFAWLASRRSVVAGAAPTGDVAATGIQPAIVSGDPAAPALATRGVTVRFGGRVAVDDVSLSVERGEIVGLIGSNGAGKSTLMNAIGGYVPSTGDVQLHGRDIGAWSPARRARQGLGRAFQNAGLFPELSVRETIQVASSGPTERAGPSPSPGCPRGPATSAASAGRPTN